MPVLIVIKDSDKFPVTFLRADVIIGNEKIHYSQKFLPDIKLAIPYYSKIFFAELDPDINGKINVTVRMEFKTEKGLKVIYNHSYPYMPFETLSCEIREKKLISDDWYAGDIHYHSNHTNDQVEFGADIPSTAVMAKAMGVSWFFVTDHSYDLDDEEDDYLKQSEDFPKWQRMKFECEKYSDDKLTVIPGAETSVGNMNNRNIHLLMSGNQNYVKGSGDGAEKWFQMQPEYKHFEAVKYGKPTLAIPAHPFEKAPFLQKKLLNRGNWNPEDFDKLAPQIIQPFNSNNLAKIRKNKKKWIELLLKGKRYSAVAGNDAHGDFNFTRQITVPFWKIVFSRKQLFGQLMTLVNDRNIIKGLKSGRIIVSNGAFLNFRLLKNGKKYLINDVVKPGIYKIETEIKSYEKIISVDVFIGNILAGKEKCVKYNDGMNIELDSSGYVRMEMNTANKGIVITNPIWIERDNLCQN